MNRELRLEIKKVFNNIDLWLSEEEIKKLLPDDITDEEVFSDEKQIEVNEMYYKKLMAYLVNNMGGKNRKIKDVYFILSKRDIAISSELHRLQFVVDDLEKELELLKRDI